MVGYGWLSPCARQFDGMTSHGQHVLPRYGGSKPEDERELAKSTGPCQQELVTGMITFTLKYSNSCTRISHVTWAALTRLLVIEQADDDYSLSQPRHSSHAVNAWSEAKNCSSFVEEAQHQLPIAYYLPWLQCVSGVRTKLVPICKWAPISNFHRRQQPH